jgi:phosphoglycolate phosphatase-like HAD superfamily hydrolase
MVLIEPVTPIVVKGLDDLVRSDFESFRNICFGWLLFSTGIVALGLLFELPEIWHDSVDAILSLRRRPQAKTEIPPWVQLLVSVGWLLIVVGVMGEFVADSFVSKADGIVTTFNETLLADAQRKTGIASERAASAFERATQTEREASQENERAAQAEQQAEQENERAAKALEAAETARKEAEGFQLQIAQANERATAANEIAERERLARLQLEARFADRVITPDQQRRITKAFASMKGQTMDVVVVGDSLEITKTSNAIIEGIHSAGVLLNFFHPMAGAYAEGVIIGIRADASDEAKQAGNRLIVILRETLDGGVGQDDFDKIAVNGTGTVGGDKGAVQSGQAPIRLLIAPK